MGTIRDRYPMYYQGHPKLYFKRMQIFWWTKKWAHMRFILRELTSIAVAWVSLVLIVIVRALKIGPEAFARLESWLSHPLIIALHVLVFVFMVFHSITWFNLAPKALIVKLGDYRIPGFVIAGLNFGAWILFSAAIIIYIMN